MQNSINNSMSNKAIRIPNIKQQQGLTLISWVVVIVFLLFQLVIAMNVLPVYMTDSSVKAIVEKLPDDPKARQKSPKELKLMVVKRLSMNSVYTVDSDSIKVKKGRGENILTIEYEPRGKLIGNLEYIVSFKHEARVPTR